MIAIVTIVIVLSVMGLIFLWNIGQPDVITCPYCQGNTLRAGWSLILILGVFLFFPFGLLLLLIGRRSTCCSKCNKIFRT